MRKQQNKARLKAAYPFGTVGYFTHRGREYPCVVVGLEDNGGLRLFHQDGLIFPERNLPLYAEPDEFRADPSAAKWLSDRQADALRVWPAKD